MTRFSAVCAMLSLVTLAAVGAATPAAAHDEPVVPAGDRGAARREAPGPWSGASDLALISSLDAEQELTAGRATDADEERNPGTAALFSLAVPGAGQLVQGQKRGYLYLLAELALWGGFYALDQKGLDERDDYEQFADENWDYAAYLDWYDTYCNCENPIGDYDCRPIAEHGSQEYYEDIGKYATYWRWWNIDGDENDPDFVWSDYSEDDVSVRDSYWDMRKESNRDLKRARYLMAAALLNHVVSAVDAFVSARSPSTAAGDAGASSDLDLLFDVADGGDGMTCSLVARY